MRKLSDYFVLYKLPKKETFYLIEDKNPLSFNSINEIKESSFIVAPFDHQSPIWAFDASKTKTVDGTDLSALEFTKEIEPLQLDKNIVNQEEHELAIQNMVGIIKSGSLGKGVLSRIKPIPRNNENLIELFDKLCAKYPNAFVYLCSLPNGEVWCGASPEVLANYENDNLKTMALAGTQLLNNKLPEELEWEEKEKEEQIWVQNHISTIFKGLNISYEKSSVYTAPAGHIAHLRSDFSATCNTQAAQEILAQLHPTPAICGTPTQKAKKVILELEKHERKYYSGFIGEYSPLKFSLFVNLRCMQIDSNFFYLYVGGGITADSNPSKEWQETENKAEVLASVILGD